MNINLRKANAIQNQILEAISEIEIKSSVTINEFQDPESEIKEAQASLIDNDRKRALLLTALYNIRGLVDQANTSSGISLLLTKSALAEKRIQQVRDLTKFSTVTNLDVLKGKLKRISERKPDSDYYGREEVTTGVVSKDDIEKFKSELREIQKQKRKYADDVLELNVKTEIPLSEETTKILSEHGIV